MLDTLFLLARYGGGFYLLYIATLAAYRSWFHPLRHIPGPALAKATYLYEWYYDLYLSGQYTFRLKALHKRYDPVIRINPDEVHINDPDYFEEVFNQTNGRAQKPIQVAEAFGPFPATIGTQSHELHRIRRSALNSFFSKKSVNDLVPEMRRPISILCERLDQASNNGESVDMKYIYAAVTLDIINDYCFARAPEIVTQPDFGRKGFDDVDSFMESLPNIHVPWLMRFTYSLPDWANKLLAPAMSGTLDFRRDLSRQVEAIRRGQDKSHETVTHRTVFHELLESKLPPNELKHNRLRDEAFSLVTAASGTTASCLRGTAYHIAANPHIWERLHNELKSAIPDPSNPPSLAELEKLPYLSAVVQEGLRLCDPVTHRISRQFPDKTLNCNGYVIPPGTTVGMTAFLTHRNETIYPEPRAFRPERWLENSSSSTSSSSHHQKKLDRYLVPFNRGTRSCLGINLAKAELFLILAAVFREFDFDVSQVVRERDVDSCRDYILGAPAAESPGILVWPRRC
ncbi:putative benzoate 4-monooxygenase cytochrome P450 [Aspergillus bertholletiae]|uniref:Putative benzoate 4-monooxygenase cytochrome P450 n=1 Tax=Aspergillus bertholletiae TaxID=1226010 RepID=A0A5N7AUE0_9EURO|nr:putative benzoate 4-monooxygenase cytochrome P450 [Aspergillus bertholletiae]